MSAGIKVNTGSDEDNMIFGCVSMAMIYFWTPLSKIKFVGMEGESIVFYS